MGAAYGTTKSGVGMASTEHILSILIVSCCTYSPFINYRCMNRDIQKWQTYTLELWIAT